MNYSQHADNRQVVQSAFMPYNQFPPPANQFHPQYPLPVSGLNPYSLCNTPTNLIPMTNPANNYNPYHNYSPVNDQYPHPSPVVHQQVVQNHYHYYGQSPSQSTATTPTPQTRQQNQNE